MKGHVVSNVRLRRATLQDAPLVHRWRSEPSASRFQPVLPLGYADVEAMLAERAANEIAPQAFGKYQWMVIAGGEPVGWITLEITAPDRRHDKGVIGYTIGESNRGQGFGKAGLASLLPIAFDCGLLNLERLEAVAAVENVASRRVLEGNGFRQEGVLRGLLVIGGRRVDHAIYGLLRTDWGTT
jgi:ribosomal-protein-alanine N-acetyltransferase